MNISLFKLFLESSAFSSIRKPVLSNVEEVSKRAVSLIPLVFNLNAFSSFLMMPFSQTALLLQVVEVEAADLAVGPVGQFVFKLSKVLPIRSEQLEEYCLFLLGPHVVFLLHYGAE